MWTRLLGPWGRIIYAVVAVLVIVGFWITALVSGPPTSRTVGNLIASGLGIGSTIIVAIIGALVLRRRSRLVAEKRGGTVFGVVRLDEHAFKTLAVRSGSAASMADGTFALVATPESVEFWKSAETAVPAISLPRAAITAAMFAPHAGPSGGGIELALDTGESILMLLVGWGGILPARDNAIAEVLAELSLPEEPPVRRWISS